MDTVQQFKAAVETGDFDGATALFAEDVKLYSPVKFKPFDGIDEVRALFIVLERTFEDFRYVGDYAGQDAQVPEGPPIASHILHFRAMVEGRQVDGIDLIQLGDDGRIATITVMIRPISALQTVGEAVLRGLVADGAVSAPA